MRFFALIGQLRVVLVSLLASLAVTALVALIAHFGLKADQVASENRNLKEEVRRLVEHTAEVGAALNQVNAQRASLDEMTQAAVTAVLGTTQVNAEADGHVYLATLPADGRYGAGGAAGQPALSGVPGLPALGDGAPAAAGGMGPADYDSALSRLSDARQQAKGLLASLKATSGAVGLRQEVLAAIPSRMPAKGWISSGFGVRVSPFHGTEERMHNGIDVAADEGTPVYATADGVVAYAGSYGGYGKYVRIEHGFGIATRYAHNGELMVKKGQRVHRGDQIAIIGVTGRTTGPHVHYEVLVHEQPVDPAMFFFESQDSAPGPMVGSVATAPRPMGGDAPDLRDDPAARADLGASFEGGNSIEPAGTPPGLFRILAGEPLVFASALPLPLRHTTTSDVLLLAAVLIMLTVAGSLVRVPDDGPRFPVLTMPLPAGAVAGQAAPRRKSGKRFDWGIWTGSDGDDTDSNLAD